MRSDSHSPVEMASVLFMDIVGYSLRPIDEQMQLLDILQRTVRESSEFQQARAKEELISLPTGDGMALVFLRDTLSPVKCALEIASALQHFPEIKLRMGVHTGPVSRHDDIKDEVNVVGTGINIAQRVMDCGDGGHILVSDTAAEILQQLRDWRECLQDLGVHEVKHKVMLHLFNLCKDGLGNPEPPRRVATDSRRAYLTVPPLPANYVERPHELEMLRRAVMGEGAASRIALTALKGMAGIGKTVLAQALCLDPATQRAFADGIIWLAVGKDPRDLLPLFREAAKVIGDSLDGYDSLQAASSRLRSCLRDKKVLIVLDDVWEPRDAAPFLMDSPKSRLLITTRDARTAIALGASQQELDVLTWEQSLLLIASWANCRTSQLPPEAGEIIRECACLPLAVAMVGAQLRGKPDRWKNFLQRLQNADLDRIRQSFPEYPHPDLLRAIDVSMEALDDDLRQLYLDFALFPEDCPIPEATVRLMWRLNQYDAEDAIDRLVELSLTTRDEQKRLRVHDLLLDYLRRRLGAERLVEKHNRLLQSYAEQCSNHWSEGPQDGYFFENLIWHLRNARRSEEALQLLFDFRWIDAKLRACGVVSVLTDYEWYAPRNNDAHLLQEAIRLSAHVVAKDVNQLAAQLLGRLPAQDPTNPQGLGGSAVIDSIRVEASKFKSAPWLRPLRQLLSSPGGALMFTLAGHSDRVRSIALTPDGRTAVSSSDDNTIKVWDLRRGILVRTLTGHSDFVRAVTMLSDGERIASASDDHTLRVWNLTTGIEEACIDTELDWIRGLVALPESLRVASVSDDRAVKVWNLTTMAVEKVLRGHSAEINCLSILPSSSLLVTGSDDRTLRIWTIDDDQPSRVLKGHNSRVIGLAAMNEHLLSASTDGFVRLWRLSADYESSVLDWKALGVRSLTISADGRTAIAAGDDSSLHVWDITNGKESILEGHSDWVNCVLMTSDGRRAISGSEDGTLKVWDLTRVGAATRKRDHGDRVRRVVVTPDGRHLLSTSDDHTLRVWDMNARTVLRTLPNHHHWVFACTPDSTKAISAGSGGSCYVWELETGQEILRFQEHRDRIRFIAVAPNGERVVSGGDDRTLRVWDLQSGKAFQHIGILSLEFHVDKLSRPLL